jgi:predicted dehydrogenase
VISFLVYMMSFPRRAFLYTALGASRVLGANDRIRLGAIGTGSRCQYLMGAALKAGGCEFAAISDVNSTRSAQAKKKLAPEAKILADYHRVLDDKSIDAVIIGAPDHWHIGMLTDALAAGKDVYIEKPLTRTLEEGQQAIETVSRSGRVVQIGYQQRSYPHIREARDMVWGGEIGTVTLVNTWWYQNYQNNSAQPDIDPSTIDWAAWLGSAPRRPFDQLRYRRWRWFWDYGGGTLTDLFSHWIDTVQWIMDDSEPVKAQASGGVYFYPEWECPDALQAGFLYPKKFVVTYDSTLTQSYDDGGMFFRGSKGSLRLTRVGYELFTEADAREQRKFRPPPKSARKAERDGTLDHMENFLACVRSRNVPNSEVRSAVAAANTAHLGNLAYKTGETILPAASTSEWRPLFNGRDLSDWIVDTTQAWSVRDGMIVGRHSGLKYNDFLRTRQDFGDFEVKLQFRLTNGEGNSGIQFRSEPVPNSHEVMGYQADIGQQYWGCLYDESRRKKVLAGPPEGALAALDKTGWNEYVVRAQGNFITLHLNGIRTVHYIETEPNIRRSGFLALQVHSGPGIEVAFKNLMIREL